MVNSIRQYALITTSYWAFTLTDGAMRMLVVLHFHQLGYSPLEIASLFLFYEFFGVVTNFFGGWLAARWGLTSTLLAGLGLQIVALGMLLADDAMLGVVYVMVAQALSGVAKDLNKMSAKSSIKLLVTGNDQGKLYRWTAALTGSKNALKGIGFFIGGLLLTYFQFRGGVAILLSLLVLVGIFSLFGLQRGLGRTSYVAKFRDLLSKSAPINRLSAARLFLFGARDVWFVVALPVYLQIELGWSSAAVGSLLAIWIIGYGLVQTLSPRITALISGQPPDGTTAIFWGLLLTSVPALMYAALILGVDAQRAIVVGLLIFAVVFAVNSAVHSFLILSYAQSDGVTLDVGFYYMSNAAGRLLGTVLSGLVYQIYGFGACLLVSALFVAIASLISLALPRQPIDKSRYQDEMHTRQTRKR